MAKRRSDSVPQIGCLCTLWVHAGEGQKYKRESTLTSAETNPTKRKSCFIKSSLVSFVSLTMKPAELSAINRTKYCLSASRLLLVEIWLTNAGMP